MAIIKIDDVDYELEDLSADARAQIGSLQAVESKIAQTTQELAILQTARNAYAAALKEAIAND